MAPRRGKAAIPTRIMEIISDDFPLFHAAILKLLLSTRQ
jgi:hypothetical protein